MRLSFLTAFIATACLASGKVAPASPQATGTLTSPHHLVRRFDADTLASDKEWKAAVCRGGQLIDSMLASDEEAGRNIQNTKQAHPASARSEWQGDLKQELRTWGWHDFYSSSAHADMDHWQVSSVVEALGINGKPKAEGGNNVPYDVQHWDPDAKDEKGNDINKRNQKYKVDDKEYRVGFPALTVSLIMGQFLESPASSAERIWNRKPKQNELPKLRRLSDVFWGYWNRDNSNLANINYFWMMEIANEDTEKIIARTLHGAEKRIRGWPGVTFDINSDAGKAILGSANGAVFAWFLIQHKEQLGNKWITKVTVFLDDSEISWKSAHLLFYVEDVPDSGKEKKPDSANIAFVAP
ncbi:uncharacterized protein N0V89_004310 [Didymosphaeria variabile]|uniref:SnoaL-like domain-containing protein n=1 Tax=Didymosphaeria variabile TaxID=1932322 RepID=A0A9W8XQ12_9PLEO|nr:uncharacterized protein N0V89_004310 [Didymosphaeria variabile]KAJ4356279.1 hypothetical protein N0V89_004310 [Didymosphaeria variabile]